MNAEVVVGGIASGGDGVGRLPDGRAVFLPRTAPGDHVLVRSENLQVRGNYARGEAEQILRPAAGRTPPPCSHYVQDRCGGCQLQHLDYEVQLAAKRRIVGDCLRRIGKLEIEDPEIVPAVAQWRYRTKISLAARERRSRRGTPRMSIGLHRHGQASAVFPLQDCWITDPRLMTLWHEVRGHVEWLPARLTRLILRLDREERRHIIAESPGEPWRMAGRLRAALQRHGEVICWWQPSGGAARVVSGPETGFPATAFEQVHPAMGEVARHWAVAQLGNLDGALVWDLYAGVGDTAQLLADRGAEVVGVDADRKAVEWARGRFDGRADRSRVRFVAARVEDVIGELPPPESVMVNPPRAGLHAAVVGRLTRDPVARLLYISCDPATLARDLHRLSVAYRVQAVRAFDLFPQTAHVETAAYMLGAA